MASTHSSDYSWRAERQSNTPSAALAIGRNVPGRLAVQTTSFYFPEQSLFMSAGVNRSLNVNEAGSWEVNPYRHDEFLEVVPSRLTQRPQVRR